MLGFCQNWIFGKKNLTFRIVCLDINLACFTFQVVKWDFGDYVPTLLSIILHLTFQGRNLVLPGVNKYWPGALVCCCLTWAWILPSSVTTQWVEELVGQHRKLITINVVKAQKAKLGLKPIFRPHAIDFRGLWLNVLKQLDSVTMTTMAAWAQSWATTATAGSVDSLSARRYWEHRRVDAKLLLPTSENPSCGTYSPNFILYL